MLETIQDLSDTNQILPPAKKSILKYVFLAVVSSVLIFAMGATYLFWWIPQAQAKEYIAKTSEDFEAIQEIIQKYEGAFVDISESFRISQGAFYEITATRNYVGAVADTKKDIEDINETLARIKKAVETKAELSVPESMETFDKYLSDYYGNIEEGMKLLLDYEKLQMDMLNASGDELNKELEKMDLILTKGGLRVEITNYLNSVTNLAQESVTRFQQIDNIPEIHQKYYLSKLDYHKDLLETTGVLENKYQIGTGAGDQEATDIALAFSERNKERNNLQKKDSEYFVRNSPIKQLFEDSVKLETKIQEEFTSLKIKYGIEEPPEATSSAKPNGSTTSATPWTVTGKDTI